MLKTLQTRTGITPNVMCRFALCYAIENENFSELIQVREDGMEINKHTLFGSYELFYVSLIKLKCRDLNLDPEKDFMKVMKVYINNGIVTLYARIKGLEDFVNLIENE